MDFEKEVMEQVKEAIRAGIREKLTGYGSPLTSIINDAVKANDAGIREVVYSAVSSVIASEDFKREMKNQFAHSIARRLVLSFADGLAQKSVDALKSDQVVKAKAIAAVEKILTESAK